MKKTLFIFIILLVLASLFVQQKQSKLPLVAIANYGPHASLDNSIIGLKESLAKHGFKQGKNINYVIADVGFNTSLIPQMLFKLKSDNPKVMVVMTTPVAQIAKNSIKDIPLVFVDITDPVSAGLLKSEHQIDGNMTGASERQDLGLVLKTAKQMLVDAKRVGILYSTAESNDLALVNMLKKAALEQNIQVVAIAVNQPRDVQQSMQSFKGKVDFIYVGTSGVIQPTLPVIVAEADKMGIPVFNADSEAVKDNLVLASIGVDYKQVGASAGDIIAYLLKNNQLLAPTYPSAKDHQIYISKTRALKLGIKNIPTDAIMME